MGGPQPSVWPPIYTEADRPWKVFWLQNAEDFQIVFDNINNVKISFLEVDDEDVHLVVGRMHRQDVRSVWAQSPSHYLDLQFQNNSFIVKSLNLSNNLDLKFQNNFFAFKSLNLSASRPVWSNQFLGSIHDVKNLKNQVRKTKPNRFKSWTKIKKENGFWIATMLTSSTNVVSRLAVTPSMQPIRTLVCVFSFTFKKKVHDDWS